MISILNSIDSSLKVFFNQLTESLGFGGYLGIVLGVEALFVLLFVIKTVFSYEARLKRSLDKANQWLFRYKKVDTNNIKDFNSVIKKGPKRLVYYWQQFILYRDGGPSAYMTEENIIEKPLKTSSWKSNIRNLMMITGVWAVISLLFGIASQAGQTLNFQSIAVTLFLPMLVLLFGTIAIIFLKGKRVLNLDDIYHIYHIFSRFITNACVDLPPYIDFDLLFTAKEIENGNPQLREYYEARARKAKEEFEKAKEGDVEVSEFNFENVGVDGALLLKRAMKESELYINKKTAALSEIAQIEGQKEALKRNFENVQIDLQRKIQASKENIQKLIEQQAATTSRIEVGLLRQQQEKEAKKKAQLEKDYEHEEQRYNSSKAELDADIEQLNKILDESLQTAQKGMASEYSSFFEKVMKSAYLTASNKVKEEKEILIEQRDKNEQELVNVQTQIKRLMDENETLRAKLESVKPDFKNKEVSENEKGHYDENGNYIYEDGSYHDKDGNFHDVNGDIYDMNGSLIYSQAQKLAEEEAKVKEIENSQEEAFGAHIDENEEVVRAKSTKKSPGRPKKDESIDNSTSQDEGEKTPKRRGRPKKISTENENLENATPKKRGRPKKEVTEEIIDKKPKKRGRPRKQTQNENDISSINEMIQKEEEKLSDIQNEINSTLDNALENEQPQIEQEREKLLKEVESLKEQAKIAGESGSEEELSKINSRLEEVINKLSALNSDNK